MSLLLNTPIQYEPLRKNRWVVRFPADIGISEWMLTSTSRPSININETEIPFINTSTWVAGRYTWDAVQMTLRSFLGASTDQALMEWVRLCAESVTGRMGYAAGYKRDLELEMLDPTGVCIQKWILKNAWISKSNFGDLNYTSDDLADVTITIRVDYCVLAY